MRCCRLFLVVCLPCASVTAYFLPIANPRRAASATVRRTHRRSAAPVLYSAPSADPDYDEQYEEEQVEYEADEDLDGGVVFDLGLLNSASDSDDDDDDDTEDEGESRLATAHLKGSIINPKLLERTQMVSQECKEGFRTGFVAIIGSPNVGKSTLMNSLIGDKLSIVTPKAQTTRHRIMGIVTGDDFQIIYSDTPGVLLPRYELHKSMMSFVRQAIQDADVLLFLTDLFETEFPDPDILQRINELGRPLVVAVNKIDLLPGGGGPVTLTPEKQQEVGSLEDILAHWQEQLPRAHVCAVSATEGTGKEELLAEISKHLPEGPPLYSDDVMSDRPMRFFASEIIREQIFTCMGQEIPYCSEVRLDRFKEQPNMIAIDATVIVMRETQKGMVIGKGGQKIKEVGTQAREALQDFFGQKVYLKLSVKVDKDWRRSSSRLREFGYQAGKE